jgi:hypothetical protein
MDYCKYRSSITAYKIIEMIRRIRSEVRGMNQELASDSSRRLELQLVDIEI